MERFPGLEIRMVTYATRSPIEHDKQPEGRGHSNTRGPDAGSKCAKYNQRELGWRGVLIIIE